MLENKQEMINHNHNTNIINQKMTQIIIYHNMTPRDKQEYKNQ